MSAGTGDQTADLRRPPTWLYYGLSLAENASDRWTAHRKLWLFDRPGPPSWWTSAELRRMGTSSLASDDERFGSDVAVIARPWDTANVRDSADVSKRVSTASTAHKRRRFLISGVSSTMSAPIHRTRASSYSARAASDSRDICRAVNVSGRVGEWATNCRHVSSVEGTAMSSLQDSESFADGDLRHR
ncbi:hypothetical protein FF38_07073 [Lucilia cuprina]|uniref:Uncharacterized protein n=1 Tax=Lucilia cuprina TaxID=7375 RepID=A0A0L0BU38_LUCCU|nr:hypothetical protein FF38_07073 [Lucilia cuprina]